VKLARWVSLHTRVAETPNGCWLWVGSKSNTGYGWWRFGGKTRLAHRVAYWLASESLCVADIDAPPVVRHTCDTPACVNPAHLVAGTFADNYADMVNRGRRRNVPVRGVAHPRVKLDEMKVREIRRRRAGGAVLKQLAQEFGVSVSLIHSVTSGRGWWWLGDACE